MLLKLIIIFVVLVVTLIIFRIFLSNDWPDNIEILDPKTLRNGDLLSTSYHTNFQSIFLILFNGTVWNHTGMVVIIHEEVYILEITAWKKNGVRSKKLVFVPYKEWINFYIKNGNRRVCLNRLNGPQISTDKILSVYEQYKNSSLDKFGLHWIRLISTKPYVKTTMPNCVCYEIIVHMLQELNIVQKKKRASSYLDADIVHCSLDMEPNYIYSKPIEINMPQSYKLIS
jgi:hypothetical protein